MSVDRKNNDSARGISSQYCKTDFGNYSEEG